MKILIVDDEPLVRNGLLYKINWEDMGFRAIGAACNGLEAIEMIRREQPDVVLTDIQMPGMTGIALADWLKDAYPDIAVIFLSGYSEFDYAKSAIELQAAHYLLKPVEVDELLRILGKLRTAINERNSRRKQYEEATALLRRHMPVLRERFLLDALNARLSREELWKESAFYRVDLTAPMYGVAKIEFSKYRANQGYDKSEFEAEKLRLTAAYGRLAELSEHMHLVPEGQHHLIVLCGLDHHGQVFATNEAQAGRPFVSLLEERILHEESGIVQVTVGLSSYYSGVESWHQLYMEAGEALAGKHYLGCGRIISYRELTQKHDFVVPAFDREKLKLMLLSGRSQDVRDYLREHFHTLKLNYSAFVRNEFMIFDLIAAVTDILKIHAASHVTQLEAGLLERMIKADTLDELEDDMAEFIFQCIALMEKSTIAYSEGIVGRVAEYLQAHYMENINLKTISAEISVHPSYISRVFHEKTGSSFTDYLIEIRMQKAKQLLLNTNLNVSQISRQVGYNNEKYFSRSFKKWAGVTSQEYRQHHADAEPMVKGRS